jgi:hypothetical protein
MQTSVPTNQIAHSHNPEDYNFEGSANLSALLKKGVRVEKGMVWQKAA